MRFAEIKTESLFNGEVKYIKHIVAKDFKTGKADGFLIYVQDESQQEFKIKVPNFTPIFKLGDVIRFENITGLAYVNKGRLGISLKATNVLNANQANANNVNDVNSGIDFITTGFRNGKDKNNK